MAASSNPLPPAINDPVLGQFVWDYEDTLLGEIEYQPGRNVTLMVVADFDAVDPVAVVALARESFERFRRQERFFRLLSGNELNKARWNDEEQLADEDVANLLLIATLEFDSDGGLTVFWEDFERLFGGNTVCTCIGPDGAFVSAGRY